MNISYTALILGSSFPFYIYGYEDKSISLLLDPLLQLVVEHKHDRRTNASPEVGEIALEETSHSFLAQNLGAAVSGSLVCALIDWLAAFHHESSSDCVERVCQGF